MKVHRVFWNHHLVVDKRVVKMQTDFDPAVTFHQAKAALREKYGYPPQTTQECARCANFAEVLKSTITESERPTEPFTAPKHFGTDCLFPAPVYAGLQTKVPVKSRKRSKGVQ